MAEKRSDDDNNSSYAPVYARVTGSDATTTGQVLADIAGLTVALAANRVYEFSAVLSVTTSAVTSGTNYGIQFSAAGAAVEAGINGTTTTTSNVTERVLALNTTHGGPFMTTSADTGSIVIRGIVTTGANAGNLTVQHLKVTSGTSTVHINSYLKVTRIA